MIIYILQYQKARDKNRLTFDCYYLLLSRLLVTFTTTITIGWKSQFRHTLSHINFFRQQHKKRFSHILFYFWPVYVNFRILHVLTKRVRWGMHWPLVMVLFRSERSACPALGCCSGKSHTFLPEGFFLEF